jgi:hypothetical protein
MWLGPSEGVQQLTREHNIYVAYSSLAPRSVFVDHIPGHRFWDSLQLFFQCYVSTLLARSGRSLSKNRDFTNRPFLQLQTRCEHKDFDTWVGTLMEACYVLCRNTSSFPIPSYPISILTCIRTGLL